jgi:hypothetical protein
MEDKAFAHTLGGLTVHRTDCRYAKPTLVIDQLEGPVYMTAAETRAWMADTPYQKSWPIRLCRVCAPDV